MIENLRIQVQSAPWYSGFEMLVGGRRADGRMVAGELTMHTQEQDAMIVEPTIRFDQKVAQELMDSLWYCGVRPSDGTGSTGQLAATEKHLEDARLQNQAFSTTLLKVVESTMTQGKSDGNNGQR